MMLLCDMLSKMSTTRSAVYEMRRFEERILTLTIIARKIFEIAVVVGVPIRSVLKFLVE